MPNMPEDKRMRQELLRLLNILRRHPGKNKAISMLALYEEYTGRKVKRDDNDKLIENVATLSRRMRYLIDELIDVHSIPVMSSSSGGYWIVTDKGELNMVRHELMSRGIRSLQKAARLSKISLVDTVSQLVLDLRDESSDIHQHVRRTSQQKTEDVKEIGDLILSPEAKMAVITQQLQELFESPEDYADQIHALQRQFGPKLLPRKVANAISSELTGVIEAANRLQTMVNL